MIYADTVFLNGKVVTVNKDFSFKQGIAVKDGWIIDVGENVNMKEYIGPETDVIDLGWKVILPGAHDAHMHGVQYGISNPPISLNLGYPAVQNIEDMRRIVAEAVKDAKPGQWIQGVGWQPGYLEECQKDGNRLPNRWDFDNVVPDHPMVLSDFSLHNIVVNSKALEICGIHKDTPNPDAGEMERDEFGEPTGVFKEFRAHALIMEHFPRLSDEQLKTAIRFTQHELNKNGVTSYNESSLGTGGDLVFGGALGERAIHVYKMMEDRGELTARVSVGLLLGEYGGLSYEDVVAGFKKSNLPKETDPNWFEISMLKIFADGLPNSYTAWLIEDYEGKPGWHGKACLPGNSDEEQIEELHKIILLAHEKGYQVGIHTVGDRAIESSIEGFIKAMNTFPGENKRHYIIHSDMITNLMARRAAKYGIGLSLQPAIRAFIYEANTQAIGKRASRTYGLKEILYTGMNAAGGSDCPCSYPNWRKGVQAAVTRKSDVTGELHCPELVISVEEGIKLYTINGAIQEHKEHVRGSIEIGKVADFQVLKEDIFQVDHDQIGNIDVLMTMVGGKIAYEK